ncbi:MAG: hypothetical protein KKB13_05410 [Chloroflexi bacterium]|nr:hypothetical protein [Chloroflexota bacterium]
MAPIISRTYAILLVLATIALGACVSQPAPPGTPTPVPPPSAPSPIPSPKPPPPADWPTRWLKGIPCRPPCWEGITPGQTTAEEAVEILSRSPVIARANATTLPVPNPEMGLVVWSWVGTEDEQGGQALFHAQIPSSPVYPVCQ